MPPRGHSKGQGSRASAQQQQQQQQRHTLDRLLERLWLPSSAACVAGGTLSPVSLEQLAELEQALSQALGQMQALHSPGQYTLVVSVAQLLALAAHDLLQLQFVETADAMIRVKLIQTALNVLVRLTFTASGQLQVYAQRRKGLILAALLMRMKLPQLLAAILARLQQVQPPMQGAAAASAAAHTASNVSKNGAQQEVLQAQAEVLEQAVMACGVCTCLVMRLALPPASHARAAGVLLRAIAGSQVLGHMAHALGVLASSHNRRLDAAARDAACRSLVANAAVARQPDLVQTLAAMQAANEVAALHVGPNLVQPLETSTHLMMTALYMLQGAIMRMPLPSSADSTRRARPAADTPGAPAALPALAGAQTTFCATLQRLGMACWEQPLVRRVLAAPGVQYWAAARMVQALCVADGRPSWGMPDVPLLAPDMRELLRNAPRGPPEAYAMAFINVAAPVLVAGLCQSMQEQQQRPQGGNAADNGSQRHPVQPLRPGGTYRIAVRALEWVTPSPPQAAAPAAAGPGTSATAAAAAALPPLPRRMRASPYAMYAARHALPLAMLAARGGCAKAAEQRLLALLPPAVGLLAGACDEDEQRSSTLVSEEEAVTMAVTVLKEILTAPDGSSRPTFTARAASAVACGALPALQAAVAWLTPEREQQDKQQQEQEQEQEQWHREGPSDFPTSHLHDLIITCLTLPTLSEVPTLRTQAAALVVSVRSAFMRSWQSLGTGLLPNPGDGIQACSDWACRMYANCNVFVGRHAQAASGARRGASSAPMRQLAGFMLAQWAPHVCRMALWEYAVRTGYAESTSSSIGVSSFWHHLLVLVSAAARACSACAAAAAGARRTDEVAAEQLQQQFEAGSSSGSSCGAALQGCGAAGQAAQHAASWRCFLLRDLRALDALGLMLQLATAWKLDAVDVEQLLDTLHAVCHALPRDVRRHLEAGRAQPLLSLRQAAWHCFNTTLDKRCTVTQAAGCGLAWLRLDAPTRALLGPARFNRPELLAFLEGGDGALGPCPHRGLDNVDVLDAGLFAAPCEAAALLPTCDNLACAAQACYLAAGRGGALPALCACPKCGRARYCSKGCRKAHWDAYHKAECGQGWWDAGSGC